MKRNIVVLSGAGISAESGIRTFRDADGLWEGHDSHEVASPEGFAANPVLVLDFYNKRRAQLKEVHPNAAHIEIANLQEEFDVKVITQNVDDLHERAGSKEVIHLHGELRKVRSTYVSDYVLEWEEDLNLGDVDPKGHQMRPHIVWFGEAVPMLEKAVELIMPADIVLIIGTSMQVYPAASLVGYAKADAEIFYIDPKPSINYELSQIGNLQVIENTATGGIDQFIAAIKKG